MLDQIIHSLSFKIIYIISLGLKGRGGGGGALDPPLHTMVER